MILTRKRLTYGFPLAVLLLVSATTLQDLLGSLLLDRGFYISESLLFKLVWVLFLPAVAGMGYYFRAKAEWPKAIWKYLMMTLLLTGLHLLLAGGLISFTARFLMERPFSFSSVERYLIVHQGPVILLLYGLIFSFIRYYQKESIMDAEPEADIRTYPAVIPVRRGRKLIPISVNEIHYIKSESPYTGIITRKGKYLSNRSLKEFQTELDPSVMVRIHRSTIVNVEKVKALKSRSNGDYDVWLENGELLRWSRNYPDQLKKLLHLGQ
jgi:two-component system LytT family response regulator